MWIPHYASSAGFFVKFMKRMVAYKQCRGQSEKASQQQRLGPACDLGTASDTSKPRRSDFKPVSSRSKARCMYHIFEPNNFKNKWLRDSGLIFRHSFVEPLPYGEQSNPPCRARDTIAGQVKYPSQAALGELSLFQRLHPKTEELEIKECELEEKFQSRQAYGWEVEVGETMASNRRQCGREGEKSCLTKNGSQRASSRLSCQSYLCTTARFPSSPPTERPQQLFRPDRSSDTQKER
ncbi:hypothetical protein B0H14DRAFT_2575781 [Mycena olivaceomarginata]|nr:hypothetical protein B0H14DRAFT_2575781 [Mycena olivaceomarginata]